MFSENSREEVRAFVFFNALPRVPTQELVWNPIFLSIILFLILIYFTV